MVTAGRPDLDNLDKFVLDAAAGVLYADDDAQVVVKSSVRLWAHSGRTIIRIREVLSSSTERSILNQFLCH